MLHFTLIFRFIRPQQSFACQDVSLLVRLNDSCIWGSEAENPCLLRRPEETRKGSSTSRNHKDKGEDVARVVGPLLRTKKTKRKTTRTEEKNH